MGHKVFSATCIGAGKEYAVQLLEKAPAGTVVFAEGAACDLPIGTIEIPPYNSDMEMLERIQRIAYSREYIRQEFLKTDCTHLYWHDADMIPPTDIVERLLAHDRDMASGLYFIRTYDLPLAPVMVDVWQGRTATALTNSGVLGDGDTKEVYGVGMGCLLIRREVVEKVGFRDPLWYTLDRNGEDYQYCLDAIEDGFQPPLLDLTLPCWHIDTDGYGSLPVVGDTTYCASYVGGAGAVTNRYGHWAKGVARPIPQQEAEGLGCEFWHGLTRDVQIKREKVL